MKGWRDESTGGRKNRRTEGQKDGKTKGWGDGGKQARNDNTKTKEGDAIFWHWTTDLVPRKAVLYLRQKSRNDGGSEKPEGESDITNTAIFARWAVWKLVEYENNDGVPGFDPADPNAQGSDLVVGSLYGGSQLTPRMFLPNISTPPPPPFELRYLDWAPGQMPRKYHW